MTNQDQKYQKLCLTDNDRDEANKLFQELKKVYSMGIDMENYIIKETAKTDNLFKTDVEEAYKNYRLLNALKGIKYRARFGPRNNVSAETVKQYNEHPHYK